MKIKILKKTKGTPRKCQVTHKGKTFLYRYSHDVTLKELRRYIKTWCAWKDKYCLNRKIRTKKYTF